MMGSFRSAIVGGLGIFIIAGIQRFAHDFRFIVSNLLNPRVRTAVIKV